MEVFNFKMLTLAREARGLSQTELANLVNGLKQSNLSMYEKGLLRISTDMIKKIARELNFPIDFFYLQENKTPISDFFYRKRLSLLAGEKIKIEAEIEILRLVYKRLLDAVEIPEPRFPSASVNENFTPADIAALAREYYKIGKGPVKNLVEILEKHGIAVFFIDSVSNKFDGMTVYTDNNHPLIVLNKKMPNDRKKFTLAHELGHQIMHVPHRYQYDLYDRLRRSPHALEEEADRFASEFLMPGKECINEFRNITYNKLAIMKMYWQVSKRAIVYRAKSLGSIDSQKYKTLMIELSRHGERLRENIDIDLDEPKIVRQIFKAYTQNFGYNNEQLAKYVCLSERDLIRVMNYGNNSKLSIAV